MEKLVNAKKIANTKDIYIVNGKVIGCRFSDSNSVSLHIN